MSLNKVSNSNSTKPRHQVKYVYLDKYERNKETIDKNIIGLQGKVKELDLKILKLRTVTFLIGLLAVLAITVGILINN